MNKKKKTLCERTNAWSDRHITRLVDWDFRISEKLGLIEPFNEKDVRLKKLWYGVKYILVFVVAASVGIMSLVMSIIKPLLF
jgi:hypothetical protein